MGDDATSAFCSVGVTQTDVVFVETSAVCHVDVADIRVVLVTSGVGGMTDGRSWHG